MNQTKSFAISLILRLIAYSAIILLIIFTSCSTIKKVKRDKQQTKTETDSLAVEKTKSKLDEKIESKTVTVEKIDTTVSIKGSTVSGSTPVLSLNTPFVWQDENQIITASVDHDGKLNVTGVVKDRSARLQYERRTERKVITDRKHENKTSSEVKKTEDKKTETKTTDKNVERSGGINGVLIFALIIIAVIYTVWRRINV